MNVTYEYVMDALLFMLWQGQCLQHAQACLKRARLVYLQISLLSSSVQVINLDEDCVRSFIEQHDKFYDVSRRCVVHYSVYPARIIIIY